MYKDIVTRDKKVNERRRYRRENGLCRECGEPSIERRILCPRCRSKAEVYRQKLRDEGRCVQCSQPCAEGKKACLLCIEKEKQRSKQARSEVLAHYGNHCTCCGETENVFLCIDHVNNDGAEHRKEIGGGGDVMCRWLKKNNYPEGFQILCWNCNMAKHINGTCPHQKSVFIR